MKRVQVEGDGRLHDRALRLLLDGDAEGSERALRSVSVSTGWTLASVRHLLGFHVMRRGSLSAGMALREAGRATGSFGSNRPLPLPPWDGAPLRGRSVAVDLEGGAGDQVHWSRFVPDLLRRGAGRVTLFCDRGLVPVLRRGVPEAVVEERAGVLEHRSSDLCVRSMSLVRLLALEWRDLDGRPWLSPDPDRAASWRERLASDRPLVVLRWTGSSGYAHEDARRFCPAPLQEVLEGCRVVSAYPRWLAPEGGVPAWAPLPGLDGTWEDTAALLSCADLVVSSETCVAVLAPAMGVATVVVSPPLTGYFMWPWGHPHGPAVPTPWYATALVRRLVPGDLSCLVALERDVRRALDVRSAARPRR